MLSGVQTGGVGFVFVVLGVGTLGWALGGGTLGIAVALVIKIDMARLRRVIENG